MSGIFGYLSGDSKTIEVSSAIQAMLSCNRMYGRDKEATAKKDRVFLGCCVDILSDSHIQKEPVISYEGGLAVIDALIFNRKDLLEKCNISKEISDSELLFQYILKFGLSSLKSVNGDFSGAIYENASGKLTLFRDHMGIRPLFYYSGKYHGAFSTDLRGLLADPEVVTDIRQEWIYDVASGYDSETIDSTPYEDICCVPPASYIEIVPGEDGLAYATTKYWQLGAEKIRFDTEKEYFERLRELVTDSVRSRLDAVSVKVAAELSGGLDSGVIDILINRSGRDCVYFSWSHDPKVLEMACDDERKVILDICEQENIHCNFSPMERDEGKSSDFEYNMPANMNTFNIMKGASYVRDKGAGVMFSGHGGDEGISRRAAVYEMFAGDEYYHYWRYIWRITTRKPRVLRTLKKGIKNILESKRAEREEYMNWYGSPELLNPEFKEMYSAKKPKTSKFMFDAISYIEQGGSRNRLDNMALQGAYAGVRYLVPFLDYRVIDFAVSIPKHLYINEKSKRYIFREAFKDIMPESLYKLNTKEDTSFANMPDNPEWFTEFDRRKKEIIGHLDRDYWSEYLDFDRIDALNNKDKPLEYELDDDLRQIKVLLICALTENILESAKRLT